MSKLGIVFVVVFGVFIALLLWYNRTDKIGENRFMKYGIGADELYHSELANKIIEVSFQYHEEHILLEDSSEYYFTIDKVLDIPNFEGYLNELVSIGDTLFKSKNSRKLFFKNGEKQLELSFYN